MMIVPMLIPIFIPWETAEVPGGGGSGCGRGPGAGAWIGALHLPQNLASSGLDVPHFGQYIFIPVCSRIEENSRAYLAKDHNITPEFYRCKLGWAKKLTTEDTEKKIVLRVLRALRGENIFACRARNPA